MLTSKNFSDIVTFTRASAAWRYSSGGVLVQESANVPRLSYDPNSLAALGLLLEEPRTNIIRNNSMAGAGPGVSPTFWSIPWTSSNGVSWSFVGTGSENGIPYIDLRLSGAASAQTYLPISIETPGALTTGQAYTLSGFIRLVAGSLSGGTYGVGEGLRLVETRSSGGPLYNGINLGTITGAPLASQRYSVSKVIDALTMSAAVSFQVPIASGQTIDATFRIGAPQLELGSFATSPILTASAQVTRASDSAIITDLSKIAFNPSAGALYAEWTIPQDTAARAPLSFNDGTLNNRIALFSSSGSMKAGINVGGSTVLTLNGPAVSAGAICKAVVTYDATGFSLCVNGGAPVTGSAAIPVVSQLLFGQTIAGSPTALCERLRAARYIPRRLTTAEQQALTT